MTVVSTTEASAVRKLPRSTNAHFPPGWAFAQGAGVAAADLLVVNGSRSHRLTDQPMAEGLHHG